MLMALNRHMLHNSLLKVQRHIATSSNSLKVITSITNNNGTSSTVNSFQQQSSSSLSSSDSDGDDALKNNPYYASYAKKLHELKK